MDVSDTLVDLIRALHLLCFAAGMGTGLYFDLRTMRTMDKAITETDVIALRDIHLWIMGAFGGLWITGLALVYIRTGFAWAEVSPKLFVKLYVMTFMLINARAIGRYVMPVMKRSVGSALFDLPTWRLVTVTQIAANSVFCWTAGLALGSSVVLKTAEWSLLQPLLIGGFVMFTVGGHVVVWGLRQRWLRARDPFRRLRVG
ncbi:MAG: hypothetical protein AAFQ64_00940 [Pseudomonadota bacterium]